MAVLTVLLALSVQGGAGIVEVRKIWDQAPHNAFTDLVRWKGRWYCVFREGKGHVSPDGALRVLSSADGSAWESAALLTSADSDLRDAKIVEAPDGRLMLGGAGALHPGGPAKHQSLVWFSSDGSTWDGPHKVADPNFWLWRVTWHKGVAYGIGYETTGQKYIRLYSSRDGRTFETLAQKLFDEGYPNETSIVFLPDESALCLLRRDAGKTTALLGTSKPPYTDWTWKDVGFRIGGPHMLRLPDGRIVAAARLPKGGVRTSLLWVDPDRGTLTEFLKLPSGGDTSYAGLVFHDGLLWVSYYSTHEGKTSIYLAKVKLPVQGRDAFLAGEVEGRPVEYRHGDVVLEGYLASLKDQKGKRPGVVVVHEWKGHNEYVRKRAEQLARLGYVAFALDMYGKGVQARDHAEAAKMAGVFRENRALMRERAKAGLDVLRRQEVCEATRVAAMGYCFGGTTALELARCGEDIRGVASFHGNLSNPKPEDSRHIKGKVIVFHGADDPFIPKDQVEGFQDEMRKAKVDWQFVSFGGAVHSFTVPEAGGDPSKGAAYDEKADRRSWEMLQLFLTDVFK